jgi:hypothetical protein
MLRPSLKHFNPRGSIGRFRLIGNRGDHLSHGTVELAIIGSSRSSAKSLDSRIVSSRLSKRRIPHDFELGWQPLPILASLIARALFCYTSRSLIPFA